MSLDHKTKDIIVIADTQVSPNTPTHHITALAHYIWDTKPEVIVHIGDNWDFESLSSYATLYEKEGRRLKDDLIAGARALDIVKDHIDFKNSKVKKKRYKPEMHFLMGNHEHRLNRWIDAHPEFHGLIDLREMIERGGWTVHEFKEPFWHEGIAFNHYMENQQSGRPVGGGIENKLNKFPHSFVHGHQQQYQFGRRQNLEGRPHFGVCAGSFYCHDEPYRGANNTEIRGFVHLKAFTNRFGFQDFDVNFVSLERLLEMY
ncbi:MAG: hypothetical protein GY800_06765 [Planctomycetes bacterium]|nr:hypothetical protein [Planctomycetota bacterium]